MSNMTIDKSGSAVELRHEGDHYALYINGEFSGSYDSVTEAIQDLEHWEEIEK